MSPFRSRKLQAVTCLVLLLTASIGVAQQREYKGAAGIIPSGTTISVRMIENLSSATSQPGDIFHGTLADDMEVNGKVIFPRGADVTGRVTDAKSSGRLSAPGVLELALTSIKASNVSAQLATEPLRMEGTSHTKSNTAKIGGGAAIGAVIGAIAGGGKGAAIGTVVGGAAGTGAAAATGKKDATVEPEALLTFTTSVDAIASGSNPAKNERDYRSYDDEVHVQPAVTAAPAKAAAPAQAPTSAAAPTVAATPAVSPEFSARDRRVLRTCLTGDTGELPAGLAKREDLPPGLAKQIQKNGTLPPGLEKRAQALPLACESQLPHLPSNVERVILNRQVILLDSQARILDIYALDQQ